MDEILDACQPGAQVTLGQERAGALPQTGRQQWAGGVSKVTHVPAASLLASANQAPPPPLPGPLSAGPVAVPVDGIRCFTPTDLGRRKGLSPQKFNRLLVEHGLQEKRDGLWCPTEAGTAFSVLLQVHKKQLAGTGMQQLKWKESVLEQLDAPT